MAALVESVEAEGLEKRKGSGAAIPRTCKKPYSYKMADNCGLYVYYNLIEIGFFFY